MGHHSTSARSTSVRAALAVGALVLGAGAMAACGDDTTASTTSTLESSSTTAAGNDGSVITAPGPVSLSVGGRATIRLEGNVTTGYTWSVTQEPDAAVVKVVSNEYVAPDGDAVGAGGHQEVVIEGVAAGATDLDMAYGREWEQDQPPALTAGFPITVS